MAIVLVALIVATIVIMLPLMLLGWLIGIPARRKAQAAADAAIRDEVARHARTLAVRRRQLISVDAYGNQDTSKWSEECEYFWQNNIVSKLSKMQADRIRFLPARTRIEKELSGLNVDEGADPVDLSTAAPSS